MSTAPRRERSDTPKVPRGLHEPSQNEHRTTTRAIWHAQSAERVARAISKWAPHHSESDLTGPKWGEGCASNLQIRTAPQREQSETHKVTRGLRKYMLDFPQSIACTTKNEHWKVKKHCITYSIRQDYGKNVTLDRWAPVYHAFFRNCVFHIFPIILSAGTHPPIRTLNAFWRVLNPWASGIDPGQQTCTLFGWFSKSDFLLSFAIFFGTSVFLLVDLKPDVFYWFQFCKTCWFSACSFSIKIFKFESLTKGHCLNWYSRTLAKRDQCQPRVEPGTPPNPSLTLASYIRPSAHTEGSCPTWAFMNRSPRPGPATLRPWSRWCPW